VDGGAVPQDDPRNGCWDRLAHEGQH
jgi:hypothetical protein